VGVITSVMKMAIFWRLLESSRV